MAYSLKVVTSAEEFNTACFSYKAGKAPWYDSESSANSFSNTGGATGESIGYIKFKDRSFKETCPMFKINNKKGKYDYNMVKLGWACDYSKPMIPLFSSISGAKKTAIVEMGTDPGLGEVTCVSYGNVVIGSGAKDDAFWSDACFVTHNKTNTETFYNNGHNKKINKKDDLAPCVIIADNSRGGDKYGYNSKSNQSTNFHRLGSFGFQDKMYLYACYNDGSETYVYAAVPYDFWWQDVDVWEIFQGLKCNFDKTTYSYGGWFKLSTIMANSTFEVTTYVDDNPMGSTTETTMAALSAVDETSTAAYFTKLYNTSFNPSELSPYMTIHSIIGLPFNFLASTDLRYGIQGSKTPNRAGYGREYTENILYDMPIAVIRPGTPTHDNSFLSSAVNGAKAVIKHFQSGGSAKSLIDSAVAAFASNSYERFYTFGSQYTLYVEYVNTLCHMFAMFLGISELDCPTASGGTGGSKTYGQYDDSEVTLDISNDRFTAQFGATPAVFAYYQPDSNLTATFDTETTESSVNGTVRDYSDKAKQYRFFGEALGLNLAKGSLLNGVIENVSDAVKGLLDSLTGGNSVLGESFAGILSGNNLSLPDIWADSTTTVSHNLKIKLVSPYGDPESIFLYVLRPLARLMALTLPKQTSANSYTEPFIIQAFSKGQFNCQLGYITSFSVTRGGEGGESQTIHHIPTEIDVDITISDMYEKVMLSNEYNDTHKLLSSMNLNGWKKSFGLLVNNIGLMDFVASYSGYNLNSPSVDTQLSFMVNMLKNRVNNALVVVDAAGKIRFPTWDRSLVDSYNDTVNKANTFISG